MSRPPASSLRHLLLNEAGVGGWWPSAWRKEGEAQGVLFSPDRLPLDALWRPDSCSVYGTFRSGCARAKMVWLTLLLWEAMGGPCRPFSPGFCGWTLGTGRPQ